MSYDVVLNAGDLDLLRTLYPQLAFKNAEQVAALLASGSVDFEAAPGSGKTTLLGAKLALIASKWPHDHRGVCILTHTNIAREEIEKCLLAVPHGESLLAYPHFIGTIQSFVNKYLALPWLKGKGIEIQQIDDDRFAKAFLFEALRCKEVQGWKSRKNQFGIDATLRGVRSRGANLRLESTGEIALPANGPCIEKLREIKVSLAARGILRHEDMFAYAEQAITEVANLPDIVAGRFPMVFIDEMQDTSDIQLGVLSSLFSGRSTVQRFGDANQSILFRGDRLHPDSFPRASSFQVNSSLRFGPKIAAAVNSVRRSGGSIVGMGEDAVRDPIMILFSDHTVHQVIERFGKSIAAIFSQAEFDKYPVKAVCAIKRPGNNAQQVGRHLLDYFPGYDSVGKPPADSLSLLSCVAAANLGGRFEDAIAAARRAVVLILQQYSIDSVRKVTSWRQLMATLFGQQNKIQKLDLVVLRLVKGHYAIAPDSAFVESLGEIIAELGDVIDPISLSKGHPLEWTAESHAFVAASSSNHNCVQIQEGEKEFKLHVSTIASVKGETHLATLVLESCRNSVHDLTSVLPYLLQTQSSVSASTDVLKAQLMNIFVAASRPRKLLAFAMHGDRINAEDRTKWKARGWRIADWTKPFI